MNSDAPITPDDPRLTAFALGELDGAEADAVAAAVAADPALQQAVAHMRADFAVVQAHLRAAETEQLEFSDLLATRVLERLQPDSVGSDAGAAHTPYHAAPADVVGRNVVSSTHWRNELGRDARRRIVWWSPFALPFAACFVAVVSVGLLWWDGLMAPPLQKDLENAVPLRARTLQADSAANRFTADAAAPSQAAAVRQRGADLFAARVWAYLPSGVAVAESALSAPGAVAEENVLYAAVANAVSLAEATETAQPIDGAGAAHPAALQSAATQPAALHLAIASQSAVTPQPAAQSAAVHSATQFAASQPAALHLAIASQSAVATQPAAQSKATRTGTPLPQAVAVDASSAGRSAQVLADAAALVRPIAVDVADGSVSGLPPAALEGVAPAGQTGDGVAPRFTGAGEVAVDLDADTGGGTVEGANPSVDQMAAVATAKHFSRASLAELEAAAFAADARIWRADTVEAAEAVPAERVAVAAAPAAAVAEPQKEAALAALPRQDFSSRYVQLKLWVEAGQLPPPASVDVDAIVRDAVAVYAPGALRQLRAQAAAAGGGALPALSEASAPQAAAWQLGATELEQLEARSLMLRLVRGYATLLRERPADAVQQLDALGEQLRQRPRMAAGRYGQEFLKLLEATRPLL